MITRKIGKLIRGSATPFQILAACLLASFIAFVPGFAVAPGLLTAWLALLVVVNANLFLAGLVGVIAKLVALLLAPVSFALGRWLLEGPFRGLFETLVNAPVFAWFGFEYPLVTGGQLVGLLFGLGAGFAIVALTRRTWRRLAALEKDSAAFQAWMSKKWVRALSWIFVGGLKGKESYDTIIARRVGNPVRVLGLVLVALLAALVYVGAQFFDDAIVTATIRSGLERANGATVDLENASLDPVAGSLTLTNLALCDPDNVTQNLFAAKSVQAKLSTSDLLRKRATIDLVTVTAAVHGEPRSTPGRRIAPPPEEEGGFAIDLPDAKTIEDIFKNAPEWRERLATIRRWLEKFRSTEPETPDETGPSYEEILRERIRRYGYASIKDDTLVKFSPTLLIRRLEAAEVRSTALEGELLNIVAENLSTQPHLTDAAPRVSIRSASGSFVASVGLEPQPGADSPAQLEFLWTGLAVDPLVAQLTTSTGTPPVQGGTIDIKADGTIGLVDSRLPLTLTLHDTQLQIGGSTQRVAELPLPVTLRGPIDQPAIQVDSDAWTKALGAVAKGELQRRLTGELEKALGGRTSDESSGDGNQNSGSVEDAARGALENLLGGRKKKDDGKTTPPSD